MNTLECIKTRRSIRKFKPDPVDHATLESLIGAASYSPSWKNTQITRYIAIEDSSILDKIVTDYTPDFNAKIIKQAPMLIAVTFKKGMKTASPIFYIFRKIRSLLLSSPSDILILILMHLRENLSMIY